MASTTNLSDIAADALNRVIRAAETIERLQPRLDAARVELHAAIREAHADGASVTLLAKVSNLSRQRVSQIVRDTLT